MADTAQSFSRRALLGAGLAVAGTGLVACTNDRDPSPTPSGSGSPSITLPTPARVSPEELSARVTGIDDGALAHLTPTHLLFAGGAKGGHDAFGALDLTSGKELWRLTTDSAAFRAQLLPKGSTPGYDHALFGTERPTAVLNAPDFTFARERGVSWSLIALDGLTGKRRWAVPLVQSTTTVREVRETRPVGGTDTLTLALVGPHGSLGRTTDVPKRTRVITTVALDTATGARVWSKDQFVAQTVTSQQVLGYTPLDSNAEGYGVPTLADTAGRLTAVTGLPKGYNARWGAQTETHALLLPLEARFGAVLVDLASAEVAFTFEGRPTDITLGTDVDGRTPLMAWTVGRDGSMTQALGEASSVPLPRLTAELIDKGVIWASSDTNLTEVQAYDRRGLQLAVVSLPTPARMRSRRDARAAFQDGDGVLSVWRLR